MCVALSLLCSAGLFSVLTAFHSIHPFSVLCAPPPPPQHDDDDEDDTDDPHKILADSVNERLSNAVHELQMKHERGRNERDHPDRAPTGSAYQHHHPQQILQQTQQQQQTRMTVTPDSKLQQQQKSKNNDDDDYDWLLDEQDNDNNNDSDGDDDDDSDDHRVLRDLRERRLAELRARAQARAANLARGHGQVRTISQDEFLPETTTATATTGTSNSNSSSEWVVCHFFHREFERCAVMDHHLHIVAPAHPECKFLRLEAARAPFFVAKLRIRVLPTLLVLRNGRVVDRLTGFEGLSSGASGCKTPPLPPQRHFAARPTVDPDAWETSALQAWLAQTGAIRYDPPADEAEREEEPEIRRQRLRGCIRRGDAAAADGYHEDDY